jgi:leader peptidase (prepilin peptidase)/N-methyltransferase
VRIGRRRVLWFAAVLAVACAAAGLLAGVGLAAIVARVPEPRAVSWAPRLAIALATALAFLAAALRFGTTAELPVYLWVFAGLVTVSAIDLRFRRLPDVVVAPIFVGALAGMAVVAIVRADGGPLVRALFGALLYFLLLFVPHLISPRGMGFGDVKLGAVLGLSVGWLAPDVLATVTLVFTAGILGMVLGLVVGLLYRAGWKGTFPLGPALALGAFTVILWSESLVVR